MSVKSYVESERTFGRNGLRFRVIQFENDFGQWIGRMAVYRSGDGNENRTNGWSGTIPGMSRQYFRFLKRGDLDMIAMILAEESVEFQVQFTLDEELIREEGRGVAMFYRIKKLRSRVVV